MYNHGLSCFVLGQAYGMTSDARVGPVLDRGLKLIVKTQCRDGGWDYSGRVPAERPRFKPGRDAGQGPAERGR